MYAITHPCAKLVQTVFYKTETALDVKLMLTHCGLVMCMLTIVSVNGFMPVYYKDIT